MTKFDATAPAEVDEQYRQGVDYNQRIELYDRVRENEGFYIGEQWEGVGSSGLEKPVFNFLGRVVSYQVATIASEAIAVSCEPFNTAMDDAMQEIMQVVSSQIAQVIEDNDLPGMTKDLLRDAAVDGDCCLHLHFDPDAETGQTARGLIKLEPVENTRVIFGNPQVREVERQPYVIIMARRLVEEVRAEMRENHMPEEEVDAVAPDSDYERSMESDENNDKVTVLFKYYRKDKSVWMTKCTRTTVVKAPVDTGYRLYPVTWMCWERVRDSYHGRAAVTGLIPNQIAVNKAVAMGLKQQRDLAFQKIIYDRAKFPNGWSNAISAVGVSGDPREAVNTVSLSADIPSSLIPMVETILSTTKDLMGASDAALGNVNPDNSSAIIALQQATAVPLELKRRAYYRFIEDTVRAALEIVRADYGQRAVLVTDETGGQSMAVFDFGRLEKLVLKLKIDIGAASYWSELTQIQTTDNLRAAGILKDPILYLEQIPDGYIRNKNKLIAQLKARMAAQAPNAAGGGVIADAVPQMQSGPAGAVPGI